MNEKRQKLILASVEEKSLPEYALKRLHNEEMTEEEAAKCQRFCVRIYESKEAEMPGRAAAALGLVGLDEDDEQARQIVEAKEAAYANRCTFESDGERCKRLTHSEDVSHDFINWEAPLV